MRALVCVVAIAASLVWQSAPLRAQIGPDRALAGADVPALLEVLKANADIHGDIVLGLAARERLAELGRNDPLAVVPLVLQALDEASGANLADQQWRIALIGVLSDIGPAAEDAVPVLRAIAADPNERNEFVRQQASLALANIGTPEAEAARDAADARTAAAWVAGADNAAAHQAAEEHAFLIRQELRSPQPAEPVIAASLDILEAGSERMAAALPTLLRAWSDPRIGTALRQRIASVLRDLGTEDPGAAAGLAPMEIIDDIVADTRSPYPLVSSLAMMELGRLGPSPRAIAVFTEALRAGRNPGDAALQLGQFGAAARSALPALVPYLADDGAGPNAIIAIGRIGDPDGIAIAELRRIVARPDSRHRGLAAAALGQLEAAEAAPDLVAALGDHRTQTRILAARALGDLGPNAAKAVPDLAALLADADNQIRTAAATALGRIGAAAAPVVPELATLLDAGDARVRRAATAALQAVDGPDARQALAADALRYAGADAAQFQSLRQSSPGRVDDLLRGLPDARRVQLAAIVAEDDDFEIAVRGVWMLVEAGADATTPLARLITESDAGGGLLAALVRADRVPQARAVIERLRAGAANMTTAERERVDRALATVGEDTL